MCPRGRRSATSPAVSRHERLVGRLALAAPRSSEVLGRAASRAEGRGPVVDDHLHQLGSPALKSALVGRGGCVRGGRRDSLRRRVLPGPDAFAGSADRGLARAGSHRPRRACCRHERVISLRVMAVPACVDPGVVIEPGHEPSVLGPPSQDHPGVEGAEAASTGTGEPLRCRHCDRERLIRRFPETGSVQPFPHGGGQRPKIPGDVVVLDNLGAHRAVGVREAIEAVGARLLYLPPYHQLERRAPGASPQRVHWPVHPTSSPERATRAGASCRRAWFATGSQPGDACSWRRCLAPLASVQLATANGKAPRAEPSKNSCPHAADHDFRKSTGSSPRSGSPIAP